MSDTRTCKKCYENKPVSHFPKHDTCIGGVSPTCRACKTNHSRYVRYGITPETYIQMYENQDGCCAICGSTDPATNISATRDAKWSFCVDHCHQTGSVRGLLCQYCNIGLGKFKDKKHLLEAAIRYLDSKNGRIE